VRVPFLVLRSGYQILRHHFSRVKSKIRIALFVWACQGPAEYLAKSILRRKNWQPIQVAEFCAGAVVRSFSIADGTPFAVEAPRRIGQPPLINAAYFPPLLAHVFHGVMVNVYSPGILGGNTLHLPRHLLDERARVITDSAGLFQMGARFAVGRTATESHIESGILIGGAGAFNWYHFVLECLPKAFLARELPSEFDELPLLVPDECRRIPSFAAAIELFSDGRPLRFMSRWEYVRVNRLVVMDEVNIGPFNLAKDVWPRLSDYRQHDAVMRAFIEDFRSNILMSASSLGDGRRIFLIRPGVRRSYNQDELIEIASRYGFEPISLESLSLQEQAKTFAEASVVVGPSGAAWVGMIFRDKPLRGLSWLPRPYEQFCAYSSLGKLLEHRIDFIEAKTERELRSTGDAYTSEYKVCPHEFENALKSIAEVL
jgi:hypothetical protein